MASIINATTTAGVSVQGDNSGSLQLATNNGTTAVTIDTSQNVGIGTSSPAQKLHVASASSTYIQVQNTGNSVNAYYGVDTGGGWMGTSTNHYAGFYTNNTERMRIDSSGNVLVGTTSEQRPTVSRTPRITSYSTTSEGINTVVSDATYAGWVHTSLDGGTGTHYCAYFENVVGTAVGQITHNGTNTSYTTSSDYRLKENIAPMTGALAKVQQLKPCTYTWKETQQQSQGFIAHELAEVIPDAVVGEKDAVETYTDENGNEQTRIKPQGIDTSFLVATLTAAIQELKAQLDESNLILTSVKTELDATKAEVQALKGTL